MIAQLLNRDFLLSQVGATQQGLEQTVANRARRGGKPSPLDQFSRDELTELAQELQAAIAREREEQPAAGDGADGTEPPAKESYAYLPREPLLGIVQSALDEYFETQRADAVVETPVSDDGRRSAAEPVVTDRRLRDIPMPVDSRGRRLWGRFEVAHPKILSDPGWVWSAVAMGWRALKGKAPFNDVPPPPITIANDARLVVVGDWGSGLQRARNVATQMKRVLDAGTAERKEQWVIHLGDVYYAGSTWEYQNRFLPYWPTLVDGGIESFTLNGNHDMFTGGHAYYATCLADPRFRRQEHCSFFQLSNDHWELFALDTSYEDGGLYGGQAQWLLDNLDKEAKKTMLFSHHQLFSGYEPGARTLQQKIKPVLDTGRVDAWFWGHEHRCLVYGEDRGVRFASCVGHGGIPEYLIAKEGDPYPPPLVYDYRKVHGDGWQPWDTFGFAVIDLTDTGFHARYVDEDGNEHKRTQFP